MKIETSEAVRRFNAAVERADYLLRGTGDRLTVEQLAYALRLSGWLAPKQCECAAIELEEAAAALPTTGSLNES